ncbi:MAG: ferrous iron transporter B [Kordiimonadales bacterium]|nr:MAG: ferrous iron transporter B [Kordiimonadales bacterium]
MSAATVAVVGNPNCGKSALFNALTGLRQKVANYPGATIERRSGALLGNDNIELIDLPGSYSLTPRSPDEAVTHDVLTGSHDTEQKPNVILCVVDATNLQQNLRFAIELRSLGIPIVLALNMIDLAEREQIKIDIELLSKRLGVPVIETVAVRKRGLEAIKSEVAAALNSTPKPSADYGDTLKVRQRFARKIAKDVTISEGVGHKATRLLDNVLLHPVLGLFIFAASIFIMFQAVFAWAEAPMDLIEGGIGAMQSFFSNVLGEGLFLSFLNDGILGGVGAVVVFLPQIIILFLFILLLESSGYMARAAFLMDRFMAMVGLNGRAFIPLLSSFACAIPGIMAARSISNTKDRLTTIMIAPLMTCSARLPVYTVIISAFIPNTPVLGPFGLQGVVLFSLFLLGIVFALIVAAVLKRTIAKGPSDTFMIELPKYQMPNLRFVFTGLFERARIFLKRAGGIILISTIVLWALSIYPNPPEGADRPDVAYSFIGIIGGWLEVIFAPIGFNWEISAALVPGMAAREVAIAALGTVYSLQGSEEAIEAGLVGMLNGAWSLPTALSFLIWYVFAPMCFSTIAVTKRETGGWKWALFMLGYLFVLAYVASFITFRTATALMS